MSAVREKLGEQDFDHLIRGGTIALIIPPSQRGSCQKVEICLSDIGYGTMLSLLYDAEEDGQSKLGMINSIGSSP